MPAAIAQTCNMPLRCACPHQLLQVASGEVKEEELAVYFYANKRSPNGEPSMQRAGHRTAAAAGVP